MKNLRTPRPSQGRSLIPFVFSIGFVLICAAFSAAQSKPRQAPDTQLSNDLNEYPGLLPEFATLLDKLQRNIQFPPPRAQSRILPLLPESTVFYAAFPNYGDASRQALQIFHRELQESAVLRGWWQHVNAQGAGKVEDFLQKFYELSQYLGDEMVISGAIKGTEPSLMFVAETKKPGLKPFLQQLTAEFPATPKPSLRILDPQELTIAKDAPGQQPVILVRPDFVVGAADIATLRGFNAQLAHHPSAALSSTPFGQRIAQVYDGGVTMAGAADLHAILQQVPQASKDKQIAFERTGFSDMKYAVWEHKTVGGHDLSQAELSFNGPRRGIASWLAAPRQLGSLDFVSPKAIFALSLALTSPAKIFDDIQDLASASASSPNPNPLAMAAPMAQALGINLKDDLLDLLTGELAVELDSVTPPSPAWRVLLGIKDQNHFRQTLSTLLSASHMQAQESQDSDLTYYSISVPSPAKPLEIGYAFLDGYLVIASSHEALAEAVHLHQSGGSLGSSQAFRTSLPPGHPSGVSALFYEDPAAMMALQMARAGPEIANSLAPMMQARTPLVVCAYGDEDAIREATANTAFDPTAVLIGAAIAVPNVLRARTAANESSAAGTLRMIDTAEVSYSATYPQRGFASSLAALGTDPAAPGGATPSHAGLIDSTLGNPSCTANTWCVKNGFHFRVTGECRQGSRMCREFVAVATPVTSSTGNRNFCSTSDGVIRFQLGPPLTASVTASDCKQWQALQ